jgi:branched-chain amino acid transport system permease protein
VTPGAGIEVIIGSLIVVVIGGLGNFWGALVGALIIGEVTAFGILFLPQWAILFAYAVMALVLVFRPQGLLMKRGVAG